jgi:hypothetical protein
MAGIGPEDLHELVEEMLAADVEALNTIPTFAAELAGAPARAFPSPGIPVWDCCEQLTVHVDGIGENATSPAGLATGRRHVHGRINLPGLITTVTRCVPVVGGTQLDALPSIESMTAAARQINADGWALWNHIYNMLQGGTLLARCHEVYWEGLRAVAPSGGCGGWVLTLRVQLDGYEEILGS